MKKDNIRLSEAQHRELERLTRTGSAAARTIQHAQILLHADRGPLGPGWTNAQIIRAFPVSKSTVERVRRRFREEGLQCALQRCSQPARPQKRKVDGQQEAYLVALMCSQKPKGAERWSLRLVAEKLVELEVVETISHETVRQVLKKTISSHG